MNNGLCKIIFLTMSWVCAADLQAQNTGIGVSSPVEILQVAGNIRADNATKGIVLDAQNGPLITRGWDAFTAGNYQGLGAWGLFMEPNYLTLGIPAIANRNMQFVTYNANSTVQNTLMSLLQNGNTGINTAAPAALLQVFKDVDIWHSFIGGGSGQLQLGGQNSTGAVVQSWNPKLGLPRDLYLERDGGNTGIGNTSPQQKLDISGNLGLEGALVLSNDPGNSGQVLTSNGSGGNPVWQSVTNSLYNNTTHIEGYSPYIVTSGNGTCIDLPGISQSFVLSGNTRVLMNFSVGLGVSSLPSSDANGSIRVVLDGVVVQEYNEIIYGTGDNSTSAKASRIFGLAAGTHSISLQLCSRSGPDIANQDADSGPFVEGPHYLEIIPIGQ